MHFTLLTPIKLLSGKHTDSLEVRSVQTVADILHVNREGKDPFERGVHLVARLTGLDYQQEATQLDMRDVNKLLDLINAASEDPRDPKAPAASDAPTSS